jgi:hypothetical protein
MGLHLWHFTPRFEDARKIQDEGFCDSSSEKHGLRWPCFSEAGERLWEPENGPALVEVWIDIDERLLAAEFTRHRTVGRRTVVYYEIEPKYLNAPGVKRIAQENVEAALRHMPATSPRAV